MSNGKVVKTAYKHTIFWVNATGALAKSVAFRSMALQSLKGNDRVGATISAYYSLLHLAIALMYLRPDKVEDKLREMLLRAHNGGAEDPSKLIQHRDALGFIEECLKDGLDVKFFEQLTSAKELREHVNYGPRVTWGADVIYVGPCSFRPEACDQLVTSLDEVIQYSVAWAHEHSADGGRWSTMAVIACQQYFYKPDLFYAGWCSESCIASAREFLKRLKGYIDVEEFQGAAGSLNEESG
ncbi:MAG TPA: hypothetical protein VF297_31950 [Pyrinomonadaceae bacterium]